MDKYLDYLKNNIPSSSEIFNFPHYNELPCWQYETQITSSGDITVSVSENISIPGVKNHLKHKMDVMLATLHNVEFDFIIIKKPKIFKNPAAQGSQIYMISYPFEAHKYITKPIT